MKQLFQNYPDTMALIKVIVVSSLFGAFLVFAPIKAQLVFMVVAPIAFLIGLIIWSFRMEYHRYDRNESFIESMKQVVQNYPDTMIIIKGIVLGILVAICMVNEPAGIFFLCITPPVVIIGLIIWSFKQERHMYDRDKPKINY